MRPGPRQISLTCEILINAQRNILLPPHSYVYPCTSQPVSKTSQINMITYLSVLEERHLQIQQDTEADESYQVLTAMIQKGWPGQKSNLPSNMLTRYKACVFTSLMGT